MRSTTQLPSGGVQSSVPSACIFEVRSMTSDFLIATEASTSGVANWYRSAPAQTPPSPQNGSRADLDADPVPLSDKWLASAGWGPRVRRIDPLSPCWNWRRRRCLERHAVIFCSYRLKGDRMLRRIAPAQ